MRGKTEDELFEEWCQITRGPPGTLSERIRAQRAQRPAEETFTTPKERKTDLQRWLAGAKFRSEPDTRCWVVLEGEFAPYLRPGDYFKMGNYESESMLDWECNHYLKTALGQSRNWYMPDDGLQVVRKYKEPVLPPAQANQGAARANVAWMGPMAEVWRGAAADSTPPRPLGPAAPRPPSPPPPPRAPPPESETQPPPLQEQPTTQTSEAPHLPSPSLSPKPPTPDVAQPDCAEGFAIVPFDVQAS